MYISQFARVRVARVCGFVTHAPRPFLAHGAGVSQPACGLGHRSISL